MNKDWVVKTKVCLKKYESLINNVKGIKVDISEKSTRGKNSKQFNLFQDKDKILPLINLVKKELMKEINNKKVELVSAWTVIGKENSYHEVHNHNTPQNHYATVLYLKVPKKKNIHQTGDFYFFLNNKDIDCKVVTVEKGTLIIMPIHIYHGSYPQPKGIRQTLNLDFKVCENVI